MTSVGRFTRVMVCAMLNVLPEPVTPSRTCALSPRFSPSTSSSIARAWSPFSSKSVTRLKRSYFEAIELLSVPRPATHAAASPAFVGRWTLRSCGLDSSGDGLEGGEIPGTGAELDALERVEEPDLHAAPGAVGAGVGRDVTERIARGDFLADLVEDALEIPGGAGEERNAAGRDGEPFEVGALLHPAAALVLQVADRIHRDIGRLDQVEHVVEGQRAGRVAAVGVEDEHFLAV